MYIFSKKKYEACPVCWHSKWADKANGKKVEDGKIVDANGNAVAYCIGSARNSWCVDTEPLMKHFINDKIAVRTGTGEHLVTFLKMCKEAGIRWINGAEATKLTSNLPYDDQTCVSCGGTRKGCIGYGSALFYRSIGYKVIDYIDFINLEVEDKRELVVPLDDLKKIIADDKYKITISSNGKLTTAVFEVDGNIVKTATAKCNPADRFNFHTGAELAFDRLFEKKHKELDLQNLKPGDKVRVRKDLEIGRNYNFGESQEIFTRAMSAFRGTVVTIKKARHRSDGSTEYFVMEDELLNFWWTPDMFENI